MAAPDPARDENVALLITVVSHIEQAEADIRRLHAAKTRAVRFLFFDRQLLPAQITGLTGVPESTVRSLCRQDERYPAQVAANRRRRAPAGSRSRPAPGS